MRLKDLGEVVSCQTCIGDIRAINASAGDFVVGGNKLWGRGEAGPVVWRSLHALDMA